MNNVLLIGSDNSWHSKDLVRASQHRCKIQIEPFKEIRGSAGFKNTSRPESHVDFEPKYDRVIVRSMPRGTLEQIIFRMDALASWESNGVRIFNPPKSLEIAIDKFLCLAKLENAGLPVPRTLACQTFTSAMEAFETLGRNVVAKPLFGGEGRSLIKIDNSDFAERVFRWLEQTDNVIYLQEYLNTSGTDKIWSDIRLLVIGDEVFGMRRFNSQDWRTNVSRGAKSESYSPTEDEKRMALKAASAINARFVGVDVAVDSSGQKFILEVNAVPGWKAIAKLYDVDFAGKFLELVLDD